MRYKFCPVAAQSPSLTFMVMSLQKTEADAGKVEGRIPGSISRSIVNLSNANRLPLTAMNIQIIKIIAYLFFSTVWQCHPMFIFSALLLTFKK